MEIYELWIEGQKADVDEQLSTLLTFALDDLKDTGSRNTAYSQTIVLPGTANNCKLLGHLQEGSTSNPYDATKPNVGINFNAAVTASCIIFQDTLQVFKGTLRVIDVPLYQGYFEFEVSVVGVLGGLMVDIGTAKLEDLDFSEYDHTYSIANILASWTAGTGSGVIYPLMDYGNYSAGKHDWQYGTFRPGLYVKEYIDKIFASVGYTYISTLFNSSSFANLFIPASAKTFLHRVSVVLSAIRGVDTTLNDPTGTGFVPFTSYTGTAFSDAPATGQEFKYIGSTAIVVNLSAILAGKYKTNSGSSIPASFDIRILPDATGVPVVLTSFNVPSQTGLPVDGSGYSQYSVAGDANNVVINTNDIIYIQYHRSVSFTTDLHFDNGSFVGITPIPTLVPILLGEDVSVNDVLPQNIQQVDFISSIVKLFNLYVWEDPFDASVLHLDPYVGFYDTSSLNAKNWTLKIARSEAMRLTPMSQLTARYYNFKMKSDSDYWNDLYTKRFNQNYGDRLLDTNYQLSKDSQDIQIIFSGTVLVGYAGEDKVYSTIFKRTGTTSIVEEQTDSNIRILQGKYIPSVTSWNILDTDNATILHTGSDYFYAGHLDDPATPETDIQFGAPKQVFFALAGIVSNNQFNAYWSSYMAEITDKDSRLLTCKMYLNTMDIYSLDFSKLINVDGVLYRIVKIENYNTLRPDLSDVTLLKVIKTTY